MLARIQLKLFCQASRRRWHFTSLPQLLVAIVGLVFQNLEAQATKANDTPAISSLTLSPEAHLRTETHFVSLSPDETGIHAPNLYDDPKMRGSLYQEFDTSSIGAGVAIGDFDGDGRPDVLVATKTHGIRLFRNLGNWKFADVTEAAGLRRTDTETGPWTQGVAFADVNNDGRLDIYVCRHNAPNLLFINRGDGTFSEEAAARGLALVDSSVMAAFCDYDRDGWLDVYVTTNILSIAEHPSGQPGHLFHNNRDGTFTEVSARAGISGEGQSHSATWWDYDNDGWPDLYVGNDYGVPDRLYHNNRDGTFTNVIDQVLPHTSFSSMGTDIGDVNNDGLTDLLVADMAATNHVKDHHFLADARSKTEEPADGDPSVPKYHRNALLLNAGNGRCLEGSFLAGIAATDWTWSVRFEDLDNDGWLDLFVTNGFHQDPGTDLIRRMMNASSGSERMRLALASPPLLEANLAFRNRGNLHFDPVGERWGLDQKGISFGTAFGDLDGDGDLDVVFTNDNGEVTVLRNDSTENHRVLISLQGTHSNRFGIDSLVSIESALGRQTRVLTPARGYLSTSEPTVHFGLGPDKVVDRLTVRWSSGRVQQFTQLSADRHYTIRESDEKVPTAPPTEPPPEYAEIGGRLGLNLRVSTDSYNELADQPLLPRRLERRGPALAVAAFNGTTALAIGGTPVQPTQVLLRAENGQFGPAANVADFPKSPTDDGPLLWLGNGPAGYPDLLITKAGDRLGLPEGAYQPVLYRNDGHGRLQPANAALLPRFADSAGAAAAADFDGDGKLDVFIGARSVPGHYGAVPRSALWRRVGDRYEDVTDQIAPGLAHVGMVTAAVWTDLDGDGWPDLVVALEWGAIQCFHNEAGRRLVDSSEKLGFSAAGAGWWSSLASADVNGDGRPDLIAGNVGLNTQYQASAGAPAVLFIGDFKGDGTEQLIEGYYENGKLYPWRTRRDLGAVFPSLVKKYPTSDAYAHATLEEIFGRDRLASARRLSASEFRSGVFLSQRDGTYRFQPFPEIAQISPWQGIVAADLDGAGEVDIFAAQNSYAPIPAVGRFDGGLGQLLRGDGRGNFVAVPPRESGLVVPGDAKAAVLFDGHHYGTPGLIVSRNQGSLLAFSRGAPTDSDCLVVELQGHVGNSTAIGARVLASYPDGSTRVQEIAAGSGFGSQSSTTCYFAPRRGKLPEELSIRWPSRKTTEKVIQPGTTRLQLVEPAD